MRFLVWSSVVLISGLVVMLAGCVSSDNSNLSAAQSPQLAKTYPCQSMHVKMPICPPG